MPIIKSAKKRVKTARKAAARNSKTKRKLREAIKAFNSALAAGNKSAIEKAHGEAISAIDVAAKKAIMHKNKAARKKSQLAVAAKKAGTKPAAKTKPVKPAPAKKKPLAKTAAKASPKKKTTTKKPASKK